MFLLKKISFHFFKIKIINQLCEIQIKCIVFPNSQKPLTWQLINLLNLQGNPARVELYGKKNSRGKKSALQNRTTSFINRLKVKICSFW